MCDEWFAVCCAWLRGAETVAVAMDVVVAVAVARRSTPNSPLPPLIFLPLPSTAGMQGQGDGINKSVYDARGRRARTPEELMRSIGTKRQWQGTLGSMLIIPEDIVKTATSLATTALLLWNKSPKLLAGMVVMLYVNRRAQVRRREKKRRREKREEERRRDMHTVSIHVLCIVCCVLCAVCYVLCTIADANAKR